MCCPSDGHKRSTQTGPAHFIPFLCFSVPHAQTRCWFCPSPSCAGKEAPVCAPPGRERSFSSCASKVSSGSGNSLDGRPALAAMLRPLRAPAMVASAGPPVAASAGSDRPSEELIRPPSSYSHSAAARQDMSAAFLEMAAARQDMSTHTENSVNAETVAPKRNSDTTRDQIHTASQQQKVFNVQNLVLENDQKKEDLN